MTERLLSPIVKVFAFIFASGLMFYLMAPTVYSAKYADGGGPDAEEVFGNMDLNRIYMEPNPAKVNSSSQTIPIGAVHAYSPAYTFTHAGESHIHMWIVRIIAGGDNWFEFQTDWGWFSHKSDTVEFKEVVNNFDASKNQSSTTIHLKHPVHFLVIPDANKTLSECLYGNHYNISLLYSWNDTYNSHPSPWQVIGMLVGSNLPSMGWEVNLLMKLPLTIGVGFIAITVLSRFIPWLKGG